MKIIVLACVFLFVATSTANLHCKRGFLDMPRDWIDIKDGCVDSMKDQIKKEMQASLQYMAMAVHFSQDSVNRPGFAKHFFGAASEEREHGMKLIEQLLMRGKLTTGVGTLFTYSDLIPTNLTWASGSAALKSALNLETSVTQSIHGVIKTCENTGGFNDYHLVDYLTGVFLEEQYTGQRELAGMISQLEKMEASHGSLGEFLYDKKLLA
ncbi:Ferritin 1 heavy chain homologue [Carabus blaptoides fortunei]